MTDSAPAPRAGVVGQFVRFVVVGGLGFVITLLVFNALRASVFSPQLVAWGPLAATVVATAVAIAANWVGNRYWAFASDLRGDAGREAAEFFAVSLVALLLPLLCLAVSHYGLHATSALADNISANVVGLALGTAFRFALYRWWVFAPGRRARRVRRPTPSAEIEGALVGERAVADPAGRD